MPRLAALCLTALSATSVAAQPEYPEGAAIPRSLTDAERAWLEANPLFVPRAGAVPTGPVRCPGEYEPAQAILIAWEGTASWTAILAQMAQRITRFGDADVWVVVDTTTEQTTASNSIAAAGADMSKVQFFVRTTDTIWIRDYGPRFIYEGGVRAIIDHVYNRPRPSDNTFPAWFGPQRKHPVYALPLTHGGGNYHLTGTGSSFATRLINNENQNLTEAQIVDLWRTYQNVATHLFDPYPAAVDSTQHIDMWMQIIADDKVVISDWPRNAGSAQDVIADGAAAYMAAQGYTVTRVPAYSVGGVHYTYTNVVMCNNIVLLPTYTGTGDAGSNAAALAAWQSALPGKTIYQIPCQSIVTASGVMHCIVMHVPRAAGGASPTVYVRSLNAPTELSPGQVVSIAWSTDDDVGVSSVDLMLSIDGGVTFPRVIASATADDGVFDWTVPNLRSGACVLKVVARDADENTGADVNGALFTIAGCPADFNADSFVDFFDFDDFVTAFEAGVASADFNADGFVDFFDFDDFVTAFGEGC